MSSSVVANTCRITVMSTERRADLAVPSHLSVADLLATLVSSLGREVADDGAAQGGWILQRAAEPPLDPASSLAASQIRDGDVLHLRTRSSQLPELAFDDVLDAVATGVLSRTARWERTHTAIGAIVFAGATLTVALAVTVLTGPSWTAPAVASGLGALVLLLAGVTLGRAYRQRAAALVSVSFAAAFAGVCGAASVGGQHSVWQFGAAQLLLCSASVVLFAVIAIFAVGQGISGLMAVVGVGVLSGIGTAVASGTTLSAVATASVIAAVGLALSPALPTVAFRLSRLPLPTIPADAADLRRDTGQLDATQVLRQAARADQFLTGLVGGVAIAVGGAAIVLTIGGVSENILAVVLGAICLLRARLFTGRAQRALLLTGGAMALLAAAISWTLALDPATRILGAAVPLIVLAVALVAGAVVLPGRRYTPPWSRTADVLESLLVLSVIPLALAVMGVYGAIRLAVS